MLFDVNDTRFETERSEVPDVKSGWKPDFSLDTRDAGETRDSYDQPLTSITTCSQFGAGDGIRTRDIQRGRLTLYQLSYTRVTAFPVASRYITGKLVGREGFEPSKAGGRQVYSLLRLTASLPPQKLFSLRTTDFLADPQWDGAGGGN